MIYILVLLALAGVVYAYKRSKAKPEPLPTVITVAGKYQGSIVLPDHEERLRAYAESRARGETNEGGGVDHGFYLEGSMDLTVDEGGNMSGLFVIHGQESPASGHVNIDGSFSGGHAGGPFSGQVTGKSITGMIFEGGGREYLQMTASEADKVPFIFGRLAGMVVQ